MNPVAQPGAEGGGAGIQSRNLRESSRATPPYLRESSRATLCHVLQTLGLKKHQGINAKRQSEKIKKYRHLSSPEGGYCCTALAGRPGLAHGQDPEARSTRDSHERADWGWGQQSTRYLGNVKDRAAACRLQRAAQAPGIRTGEVSSRTGWARAAPGRSPGTSLADHPAVVWADPPGRQGPQRFSVSLAPVPEPRPGCGGGSGDGTNGREGMRGRDPLNCRKEGEV